MIESRGLIPYYTIKSQLFHPCLFSVSLIVTTQHTRGTKIDCETHQVPLPPFPSCKRVEKYPPRQVRTVPPGTLYDTRVTDTKALTGGSRLGWVVPPCTAKIVLFYRKQKKRSYHIIRLNISLGFIVAH